MLDKSAASLYHLWEESRERAFGILADGKESDSGMGHFGGIDWVVLVGYFAFTMSIGFYFYRKSRSSEGFMAADRSLPGWACGLSILATYLSSISFLALPGKAYAANWNPFVFSLSLPIATWIAVKFFMPYYRRTGDVSAYARVACVPSVSLFPLALAIWLRRPLSQPDTAPRRATPALLWPASD